MLHCSARASYCTGFSCFRARALGTQTSVAATRGLECGLGSAGARAHLLCGVRDQIHIPSTGRPILNHWVPRKVPSAGYFYNLGGPSGQECALCSASIVPFSPSFHPLPRAGLKRQRAGGTLLHAQGGVAPFPDEEAEAQGPTAGEGQPRETLLRRPLSCLSLPAWFGAAPAQPREGEQAASSHHNPEPPDTGTRS